MKVFFIVVALMVCWIGQFHPIFAGGDFGLAENALSEYGAVRFENIYTKVPTTGKLVSIKIADNGKIFYICKEKAGYVIYHLEIRPIERFRDKIEQEVKEQSKQWDKIYPDELLFTKERYHSELMKRIKKYSEAVWVRNEIVIE
jgi:hypothetical protein